MIDEKDMSADLKSTVVRICPACGVVNPAGPSESCPHLQLARFTGIDEEMTNLLVEVAKARSAFSQLAGKLKNRVREAIRTGEAEIQNPRKIRPSEMETRRPPLASPSTLKLVHPKTPVKKTQKTGTMNQRKPPKLPRVDPRQLDLIAREPPKGEA
jgi:hypothetical protein